MQIVHYFAIQSPIGYWSIHTTETHIVAMDFLGEPPADMRLEAPPVKLAQRIECMLSRYFKGERIDFSNVPIQYPEPASSKSKNLRAQVMRQLLTIPYGQTQSYQWMAEQLGIPKGVRAVGGACGRNTIPVIVPCHRIIAKHGKLGGFMQGRAGGLAIKQFLLELEGLHLVNGQYQSRDAQLTLPSFN